MSGSSTSGMCPACDSTNYDIHTDYKPFDSLGTLCHDCGFSVYTKFCFENLDFLNKLRSDDAPLLKKLNELTEFGKQLLKDWNAE